VRFFVAAVCFALLCPLEATASCAPGAPPSYADITYVKFVEYSLVAMHRPAFTFTAVRWLYKRIPPKTYAALEKTRATLPSAPSAAVNPEAALAAAVNVLRQHDFFAMHLSPMPATSLDGPEDSITVARCGVFTTISTISNSDEVNLDDAQAKSFFALEDDLRTAIFKQQWQSSTPQPQPASSPLKRRDPS
jgi:hypothetical protein